MLWLQKIKKQHTVQSLFSKLNPLPFPKSRSDFRSKWLLLQALHIFLLAEFHDVGQFMSQDFVV